METYEVLQNAKAILQEHGRTKMQFVSNDGRVCLYEALHRGAGGAPTEHLGAPPLILGQGQDPRAVTAKQVVEEITAPYSICHFNNASTDERVFAMLDRAIEQTKPPVPVKVPVPA